MLLHVISSLASSALPVVWRLLLLLALFHGAKFLLRQWRGLKKR